MLVAGCEFQQSAFHAGLDSLQCFGAGALAVYGRLLAQVGLVCWISVLEAFCYGKVLAEPEKPCRCCGLLACRVSCYAAASKLSYCKQCVPLLLLGISLIFVYF